MPVYLIMDGVSGRNGTAQLVILPVEVSSTEGGCVVEFSASSRAAKSVAAVEIKGELRDGDELVEESSAALACIPQNSHGWAP